MSSSLGHTTQLLTAGGVTRNNGRLLMCHPVADVAALRGCIDIPIFVKEGMMRMLLRSYHIHVLDKQLASKQSGAVCIGTCS